MLSVSSEAIAQPTQQVRDLIRQHIDLDAFRRTYMPRLPAELVFDDTPTEEGSDL